MTYGTCARCGRPGITQKHHRQMRSQGGDDSPENLVDLCAERCHPWVHANPALAYEHGWLVKSWADPAEVDIQYVVQVDPESNPDYVMGPGDEAPRQMTAEEREHFGLSSIEVPDFKPHEGEICRLCERRVPHKRKATSPKTKTASIRIPIDDVETWEETLEAAAEHAGLTGKPHHKYWTLHRGLVLLLQGPGE